MRKTKLFILLTFLLSIGLNSWATEVTPSLSGWTSNVGTGGSVATDEATPPVTTFTCGATKGNAVSLTSTTFYADISKIALDLKTSDRAKMDVKIEIGTLEESVFTPIDGGTFTSTYTGEPDKKLIIGTIEVSGNSNYYSGYVSPENKTGYVRVTITQASGSNNKIGYVKNLKVTCSTAPKITTQPASAAYVTGYAATALHVAATTSGGDLSYQWYRCADTEKNSSSAISGATVASYTPSTENAGTFYYYCVVSDSNGSTGSNVATITVAAASAPTINVSGAPVGDIITGTEVTLTAAVTGVPSPTIKWFSNTTASTSGSDVSLVATGESYSPSTATPGTYYYFAQAVNSEGNALSTVQTLVVKDKVATPTFTPNGADFTSESQSVAIACATASATIQYSTDNGDTWNNYTEAISVTATTTIKAKATKSGCIDSDEASATFTKYFPQTNVTSGETWNWANIGSTIQLTGETTPTKSEEFLLKNVEVYNDPYTIPAEFGDAQKLLVIAEYPFRNDGNGKMLQGNQVTFHTTVPGLLDVDFSNTGSNRPYRYLYVNDVNSGLSNRSGTGTKVSATGIAIDAGDVKISGYIEDASDPQSRDGDVVGATMLRIYKIVFTPVTSYTLSLTAGKWASFCPSIDVSIPSGVTAYKGVVSGSDVILTPIGQNTVKAGVGVILKASADGEYTFSSTTGSAIADNSLLGTTVRKARNTDKVTYALYTDGGIQKFTKYTGTYIPANKAYFELETEVSLAPSAFRIVDGETNATNIQSIEVVEKAVKFFENGQLFIQKNGVVYDITGRIVK